MKKLVSFLGLSLLALQVAPAFAVTKVIGGGDQVTSLGNGHVDGLQPIGFLPVVIIVCGLLVTLAWWIGPGGKAWRARNSSRDFTVQRL